MKKKIPVDQQAAALTEEQKQRIPKLFWIQIITSVLVILALIGAGSETLINQKKADEAYEEYQWSVGITGNPSLFTEEYTAWMEASDAAQASRASLYRTSIILFVVLLIMIIYIKVKHPYYSDKLYFYLRKHK